MLKKRLLPFLVFVPWMMFAGQNATSNNNEDPTKASQGTESEDGFERKFAALDWKYSGSYKLPKSSSTIALPEDYAIVIGDDAQKENAMMENFPDEDLEAVVYDSSGSNRMIFRDVKAGYVSLDDWSELDPVALLKEISDGTESLNPERKQKGMGELHVVGWLQEPFLNRDTNTVYWTVEAVCTRGEKKEGLTNSVALSLGRYGYEKVVLISTPQNYVSSGDHLATLLRAHSFDEGYRYQDHKIGDAICEYGIAGVVAATVGAGAGKIGGLLVLIKKMGVLLVAGAAALFCKLKKYFGKS